MKYKLYSVLAIGLMFLTGCESDIISDDPDVVRSSRPLVMLTVASDSTAKLLPEKTILNDQGEGNGLSGEWLTSDEVGTWNITEGIKNYNTVKPTRQGKSTSLEGRVNAQTDDRLAFFYPQKSTNISVDPYEDGQINVDFRQQGGTLESIAGRLDLVWGSTTVNVIDERAYGNLGMMKAAHTLWHFKFQKDGKPLSINKCYVRIKDKDDRSTVKALKGMLNLATDEFVSRDVDDTEPFITITLDSPKDEIYFVTPPNLENCYFEIEGVDEYGLGHIYDMIADGSEQNGNKPGLYITQAKAGKLYRLTGNVKESDYIEFDGTKWAKGNLIWSNGSSLSIKTSIWDDIGEKNLSINNYFIAPSQEWSPEQIVSENAFGACGGFPDYSPLPGSTKDDYFWSIFIAGACSRHGLPSAHGCILNRPNGVWNKTTSSPEACLLGNEGLDFRKKIFYGAEGDVGSYREISLAQALSGDFDYECGITGLYHGDLAYFATAGEWCLPTYDKMHYIVESPDLHRAWAVIWVDISQSSNLRSNKFEAVDGKAPVFGAFISKKSLDNYSRDSKYYEAIRLEKEDMKKGLFLPAEGFVKYESSFADTKYNKEAGTTCCYIAGYLDPEQGVGVMPAVHYMKFYNEGGMAKGVFKDGSRLGRYAIRPVKVTR